MITTLEDTSLAAYLFAYPLVSMEVTRRQATALDTSDGARSVVQSLLQGAPMNHVARVPVLPDATFTGVVRPNLDTLYTNIFYDVSAGPLIVTVPDMSDRYHLFQVMDMWTEVVAAPGSRTLPDEPGYRFAIVGPDWQGELPGDVHAYRTSTDVGWVLGRIEVSGDEDLETVRSLQRKVSVEPVGPRRTPSPPAEPIPVDVTVAEFLRGLDPQGFWDFYHASASHDQTRPGDEELLERLAVYGWNPTERFDLAALPESERAVWEASWTAARATVEQPLPGDSVAGWTIARSGMGSYGTDYPTRAVVAANGFGANLPDDAVYPQTFEDAEGEPLDSSSSYVLHFAADAVPPVAAFWSLTLYDAEGYLVENALDRFSVRGERLTPNADGSVDVLVQSEEPEGDTTNWLPAPTSGGLMLRLYWPDESVLDGTWNPPGVTRSGSSGPR